MVFQVSVAVHQVSAVLAVAEMIEDDSDEVAFQGLVAVIETAVIEVVSVVVAMKTIGEGAVRTEVDVTAADVTEVIRIVEIVDRIEVVDVAVDLIPRSSSNEWIEMVMAPSSLTKLTNAEPVILPSGTKSTLANQSRSKPLAKGFESSLGDQNNEEKSAYTVEGSEKSKGRKSYRKLETNTNLPKDWVNNDENRDGQIAMSEFISNRSDREVSKFEQYDQNGDGVISPREFEIMAEERE